MLIWTNGKRHAALTHSHGLLVWDADDDAPRVLPGPATSDPDLARSSAFAVAPFGTFAWARYGRADIRRVELATGARGAPLAIAGVRFVAIVAPRVLLVGHQVDERLVLSRTLVDLEGRVLERTELVIPDVPLAIEPAVTDWAGGRVFGTAGFARAEMAFVVHANAAGITVTNVPAGLVALLPADASRVRALLRVPRDYTAPGHVVAIATEHGVLTGTSLGSRAGYMAHVTTDGEVLADSATLCFGAAALLPGDRALYVGAPTTRSGGARQSVGVMELDLARFTATRLTRSVDHAPATGYALHAAATGDCAIVGTRDAVEVLRLVDGAWSAQRLVLPEPGGTGRTLIRAAAVAGR